MGAKDWAISRCRSLLRPRSCRGICEACAGDWALLTVLGDSERFSAKGKEEAVARCAVGLADGGS